MFKSKVPDELRDVLESIRSIKGQIYVQLVMHSINTANIIHAVDDRYLRSAVARVTSAMLADITILAKINIDSADARKEYENNIQTVTSILKKIKSQH